MGILVVLLIRAITLPLPKWKTEFLIAQSKLETSHFTSDGFKRRNNLFGMQHPTKRPTLSTGVCGGEYGRQACFNNYAASIIDRVYLYEAQFPMVKNASTLEQYMVELKKAGYWEASNYEQIIKSLMK